MGWERGEVDLLSPEGSHERSFRILGGQGSGRLPEALGPSNPEHPVPPTLQPSSRVSHLTFLEARGVLLRVIIQFR